MSERFKPDQLTSLDDLVPRHAPRRFPVDELAPLDDLVPRRQLPNASTITDDALDEVRARLAALEQQAALRICLVPGCLRQYDVIASLTGATPVRPEWCGKGWRSLGMASPVHPAGGHICPAHVDLVTAHLPHRVTASGPHLVAARCACGNWTSPEMRWHGAVRGLWEEHLLEADGARPDAEQPRHACERHPDAPRIDGRCAACTIRPDANDGERP